MKKKITNALFEISVFTMGSLVASGIMLVVVIITINKCLGV